MNFGQAQIMPRLTKGVWKSTKTKFVVS